MLDPGVVTEKSHSFHVNHTPVDPVEMARPWKREGDFAVGAGGSGRTEARARARLAGLARRETHPAGGERTSHLLRAFARVLGA